MEDSYEVVIQHEDMIKRLYTTASSLEEAAEKFNRYIVCHWCGYLWNTPEELLAETIDKLPDHANI